MNYFSGFLLLFIITSLVVFIIIVIFRMMKQEVIRFILPPTLSHRPPGLIFFNVHNIFAFLKLNAGQFTFYVFEYIGSKIEKK